MSEGYTFLVGGGQERGEHAQLDANSAEAASENAL